MIDRWGKPIQVGWARHEEIWVRAALSLPRHERPAAYRDISELTGRSYANVRDRANHIRLADARNADQARFAAKAADMAGAPKLPSAASLALMTAGRSSVARLPRVNGDCTPP